MNNEQPIGQRNAASTEGVEPGEHGAGVGVSGGYPTTQGQAYESGGHSAHPIADKFMAQQSSEFSSSGAPTAVGSEQAAGGQSGLALGSALGGGGGGHSHHHHHHGHGGHGHGGHAQAASQPQAVSGAYEGGAIGDALTGQSKAVSTGAGVGYLGENLPQSSSTRDAALSSTAGGATGVTQDQQYGTGVGPAGGAGGHYSSSHQTGYGGLGTAGAAGAGAGVGTALGAGAGAGAGLASGQGSAPKTGSAVAGPEEDALVAGKDKAQLGSEGSTGAGAAVAGSAAGSGHYGTVKEETSGEPISNPEHLDSGGRHGLVYQESTGKYVHRHEL